MPRPVVIALVVLAAFVALPTVWTELLGYVIGDGSEPDLWFASSC